MQVLGRRERCGVMTFLRFNAVNISFKKIDITNKALENYKSQKNVIRKSGNSRLNYGKIVGLQDMDPD